MRFFRELCLCLLLLLFNGFLVVATLLHFVVSIKPPLVISCYLLLSRLSSLSLIIVSHGNRRLLSNENSNCDLCILLKNCRLA